MRTQTTGQYINRTWVAILLAGALNISFTQSSSAQEEQPAAPASAPQAPSASSPVILKRIIAILADEGVEALRTGQLQRTHANIASENHGEVIMTQVAKAIIEPQHRDPFVDGYIRWQLTSYDPPLPKMADAQWQRMIENLPMIPINPRADADLIKLLNQGIQAGELSEDDQKKILDRITLMSEIESNRRALMTPAVELRAWIMEKHKDSLYQQMVLSVEKCAALVRAGWPTGDAGAKTAELFAQAARDREITDQEKLKAARVAESVIGLSRVYVASVRINNNRLEADFENTAIYDFDVRKWIRSMERQQ